MYVLLQHTDGFSLALLQKIGQSEKRRHWEKVEGVASLLVRLIYLPNAYWMSVMALPLLPLSEYCWKLIQNNLFHGKLCGVATLIPVGQK